MFCACYVFEMIFPGFGQRFVFCKCLHNVTLKRITQEQCYTLIRLIRNHSFQSRKLGNLDHFKKSIPNENFGICS